MQCTQNKSVDLRRWASEGSRPRLPWGERIQDFIKDPSPTLLILEELKFDNELYVRKSVSNHLNDITKDHPLRVIQILSQWKKQAGPVHQVKIDWIIHRALRTLIKSGHPEALKLLGVRGDVKIQLSKLKINSREFNLGDRLNFNFKIRSLSMKPQKLIIDYIIHFVKANRRRSAKVFKLKTLLLPESGEISVTKSHHLKEVTTRSHLAGEHLLEIQINGVVAQQVKWKLVL